MTVGDLLYVCGEGVQQICSKYYLLKGLGGGVYACLQLEKKIDPPDSKENRSKSLIGSEKSLWIQLIIWVGGGGNMNFKYKNKIKNLYIFLVI